jgi:succinate dehydrogenase / fumarate reductase flavoprotein subunit
MVDVLIIGSGGAGLSAALEAKKNGSSVLVVSKTYPTQSQTSQAQGGINGVLKKEGSKDSIQSHINDTLKSAHHIGDEETISFMCTHANETIQWLDTIGVPFSRDTQNTIAQRKLGGASYSRACYSSDYTGLKILHTLYDNCLKENIEFLNETMLLNFIIEDNTIKGITTLDIKTSEVKQLDAKCVIVASGGYGAIYEGYTTNSNASTGDAIAAALRANVQIANMEYIQFHPTTLKENSILLSESARGEGGYLVTLNEKRFVDELAPRDVVARAIDEKIKKGQEVFLDLRHLGLEKIKETMPQEYELALQFGGFKLDCDLIPIKPAAHYTMGGIKTNMQCETNIQNLYAVGECSSNGVHGANRLGGNSLLEIITFGRFVGQIASEKSNTIQLDMEIKSSRLELDINFIETLFLTSNEVDFYGIKKELGALLYNKVGLFRDKENLDKALDKVEIYRTQISRMGVSDKSKIYNTNLKEYIEFLNMLELADTIIICAKNRCESRGAHYRVDYPNEDEKFAKDSVVIKTGNNYNVELV